MNPGPDPQHAMVESLGDDRYLRIDVLEIQIDARRGEGSARFGIERRSRNRNRYDDLIFARPDCNLLERVGLLRTRAVDADD